MGALFSNQKKASKNPQSQVKHSVTDKDRAILELKNARDRLKRYKKKLDGESIKLNDQAIALVKSKHKTRALLVLKLKRHKEKEADNIDNQLFTVFEMIDSIEWESTNVQVLEALKSGTEALNQLHDEMSVDDVASLLEETNEAIEMENKINNLLAGQMVQIEDDELENKLNLLMSDNSITTTVIPPTKVQKVNINDNNIISLPEAPTNTILPTAPTNAITTNQELDVNEENQSMIMI